MDEVWKKIDDRYSVSNLGRIKSTYSSKERILKQRIVNGYAKVNLYNNGVMKSASVHRLVAEAFIPNPDNLTQVNHIDENKTNNYVENLEWCSPKYNCNYGTRNTRMGEAFKKKICSVDKNGIIEYFNSGREASSLTGISASSISIALNNNQSPHNVAGGRLWFYDDGNAEQIIKETGMRPKSHKRPVYSVDKNGNIEHFDSVFEAKKITGANNIHKSIKNGTRSGGRLWFYDE